MEEFARKVRAALSRLNAASVPHFRQVLRFIGLPYCYFFLVNWEQCTASRLQVAKDMLYIFFVLRNFPDNYGHCRFYEKPRSEWVYYFGSNYNPFQRGRLFKSVQPPEYQVVFEDKEVCQKLLEGHGFPVPRYIGTLLADLPFRTQLADLLASEPAGTYYVKPVMGSAGKGVLVVERTAEGRLQAAGRPLEDRVGTSAARERYIVQGRVEQDERMAAVHPASVNTIRTLTLMRKSGEVVVIGASVRFGVGDSGVDNWSAGGIAIGVDRKTGQLFPHGFGKQGVGNTHHPVSGVEFGSFRIPRWDDVVELSQRVQSRFSFYRILGLDVAIGRDGPVVIEVNAYPDFAGQEQSSGPLLKDPEVLEAFREYDLLYNGQQRRLGRPSF